MTKVQNISEKKQSLNIQRHFIKELSKCLETIDICDERIKEKKNAPYYGSVKQEAVEKYAESMTALIEEVITSNRARLLSL